VRYLVNFRERESTLLTPFARYSEVGVQILIVFFGGSAFQVTSINGRDWGISVVIGFLTIPLGVLIRLVPNGPCERVLVALRILAHPKTLPTAAPHTVDEEIWNPAIELVRDNLTTWNRVRGGRVRASSFVGGENRHTRMSEAGIQLSVLSLDS
jgi:Ca2+-transporting ATPase